jgi:hypothetical protein
LHQLYQFLKLSAALGLPLTSGLFFHSTAAGSPKGGSSRFFKVLPLPESPAHGLPNFQKPEKTRHACPCGDHNMTQIFFSVENLLVSINILLWKPTAFFRRLDSLLFASYRRFSLHQSETVSPPSRFSLLLFVQKADKIK